MSGSESGSPPSTATTSHSGTGGLGGGVTVDRSVVKDALQEILREIPAFRTLMAAPFSSAVIPPREDVPGTSASHDRANPTEPSASGGSTHPLGVLPPHTALAGLPLIPPGTTDGTSTFVSVAGITPTTSVTPATVSSSALLSNLLPLANASLTPSVGAYVGEGVPPVPPKLVTRIHRLDFVEMGELLPEFWVESNREVDPDRRPCRSRKVTDIFTWLQCFGSFTAVLATHNPGMIPELMAYMGTIVRVSQDFAGLAWVRYDEAFRRQAALTGNTKWSVINSTLYTLCFTSTAPSGNRRCELCLASSHTEADCALRGDPDPDIKSRLKNLESAVLSFSKSAKAQPPLPPMSGPPNPSGEVCRKWNAAGCSYPRCRHLHVCATCGDNGHPASRCSVGRRPPPAMAHRTGGVGRPSAPY